MDYKTFRLLITLSMLWHCNFMDVIGLGIDMSSNPPKLRFRLDCTIDPAPTLIAVKVETLPDPSGTGMSSSFISFSLNFPQL